MCPRCGYDQRGVVASWTSCCPLNGVCSECGLEYSWRLLLNPELSIPWWSFEHAAHHRTGALLRTAARCFRPGRLYSVITLFAPIHAARLLIMVMIVAVFGHMVVSLTAAAVAWARFPVWGSMTSGPFVSLPQPWNEVANSAVWPYQSARLIGSMLFDPIMSVPILWALFTPLPFIVLGTTFKTARVRRAHLLRGLCYSLGPVMLSVILGVMVRALVGLPTWVWSFGAWQTVKLLLLWYTIPAAAMLARHWWVFVHRYLRLPHGAAIVGLMLLTSLLGAVAVALAITPGLAEAIGWLLVL